MPAGLSPYIKTIIGMYSFLDHRYPIGFVFIPLHHVLGTIYRGGATGRNLGHLYNMEEQFSVSLQVLLLPQSIQKISYLDHRCTVKFGLKGPCVGTGLEVKI